jgi:hypothetical protein
VLVLGAVGEVATGAGNMMNLFEVAKEISDRLTRIFLRDERGQRAGYGGAEKFQTNPQRTGRRRPGTSGPCPSA